MKDRMTATEVRQREILLDKRSREIMGVWRTSSHKILYPIYKRTLEILKENGLLKREKK